MNRKQMLNKKKTTKIFIYKQFKHYTNKRPLTPASFRNIYIYIHPFKTIFQNV